MKLLYISHGGGPMPLLGDPGHQALVDYLSGLPEKIGKPSAILVVSAHWEEAVPTITAGATPPLIYDYYGFPEESYHIAYPCPGEPGLARQVKDVLQGAGIEARLDVQRGFDHGLFVPLKLMYPAADIPCVQLSLVSSLDAEAHLAVGRALQALDYENLLVLGSGFSFHNMKAFFGRPDASADARNDAFQNWLEDTLANRQLPEAERYRRLADWQEAPHARFCHPREEHLLPLHVCYGIAGKACDYHDSVTVLGKRSKMIGWGLG